jgi:predicted nuclease with RNAse H fold
MKIMGIDPAGRVDNPTGICVLYADNTEGKSTTREVKLKIKEINFNTIYTDEELVKQTNDLKPSLMVIDAPLSLPKGRCCLEKDCECAVGGHFRQSEREIRRYGPVLPLTFKGMKMLTMRGVALNRVLSGEYQLKETHPRTAQKILGFENLKKELGNYFQFNTDPTEHELDAALAALTGFFYLNDCYLELGDADEGTIILPKSKKCLKMLI